MTDADREALTKELAEKLHEAATTPPPPEGAVGLVGGINLWGFVASRLIDMMQEIAREAVEKYLGDGKPPSQ